MHSGLLAAVPLLVGVVVLGGLVARALAAHPLQGPAQVARRRAVVTSVVTVLATLAYAFLAPWPSSAEVRTATLPALAALVGVLLAGLAELTWPRPRGERRQASITARRGTEARTLKRLFLGGLATSAGLLVIGVLTAGRTGRAVTRDWATGSASSGPYPGLPYAVPMGLALAALALATWWALRMVDTRPALDPELEEVDRAVRLAAEMRVLRFAAGGSLLTAAGLAGTMGIALNGVTQTLRMNWEGAPRAPWDWPQNAGFLLIALGVVAFVTALFALFTPSPSVPAPDREPTPEASEVAG